MNNFQIIEGDVIIRDGSGNIVFTRPLRLDAEGRLGVYFETGSGFLPIKITSSDITLPVNINSASGPIPVSFSGTLPITINGTSSALPVSFSGTMPVSIASTLNVNIASTSAPLPVNVANTPNVNISSTTGALPVNLTASSNTTPIPVGINQLVLTKDYEYPTYSISATGIVLGNNKSLLSIHNAHSSTLYKIQEIYLINTLTTSVTGVACTFELRRLAGNAPTGGTDLSTNGVEEYDTVDPTPPLANFTVRTGATVAGESSKILYRVLWSSDEWKIDATESEGTDHALQTLTPLWKHQRISGKPIILRQNQGLTIKCATNTILGVWDIFATVTVEG